MPRWGKAGQRLTEAEAAGRDRSRRAEANKAAAAREKSDAIAKKLWEHGLIQPYRITAALDAGRHEGPEVDEACGVEEPTVDLWEAGKVYPTWEQLLALSELTGYGPIWFTRGHGPEIEPGDTSLRFHTRNWKDTPALREFDAAAIHQTLHGATQQTLW